MTFLARLFGFCPHTLSFPQMRRINGRRIGEYQICTTCAREWKYDWKEMRISA